MRTIIAGSRNCTNYQDLLDAINECGWKPSIVISGAARGADTLGEQWSSENLTECKRFPANWNKYGKSAGYRRNCEMAEHADALIALWDGKSSGTNHMINIAKDKGLLVYVHHIN